MGRFVAVLHSTKIHLSEARCPAWPRAPERLIPAAVDTERALLGAILLDATQMLAVVEVLPPGQPWFYQDSHRLIYDAMLTLFERRDPIDFQTVTDVLYRRGHLEKIGGSVYLADLSEVAVTTANAVHHARLVREKALYRSLINVGTELQASAYAQDELSGIIATAHQSLLQIAHAQTGSTFSTMHQLMQRALHDADHAEQHDLTGIDTGFFDLNHKTSGWQKSDLIILAARPSIGKTALAPQFAVTAGRTQSLPVVFFSLEVSEGQLANRMLAAEARMSAEAIRRGGLSQSQYGQLMNAAERLRPLPILVDDKPSLTVLDVRTRATRVQMEGGLAMLVVDYLQLMSPVKRLDSRQREVAEISRELKILAKELHVPILALSQLSREIEKRSEHKPVLSDTRESGSVEQDADVVMFLYREKEEQLVAQPTSPTLPVKLLLAKQRNGPTGEIDLIFHKAYARFDAAVPSYAHGGPVF